MIVHGRDEQLARARAVLIRTIETGQGAIIVVSGEPGIGKSAVLRAVSEQAALEQFSVGFGKAEEQGQIAPMAPLLMALRSGSSPLLTREQFEELAPLYGRQLWLVDRLGGMLEERSMRSSLLIIVDDAQWMDRLSAFALRMLVSQLAGSAIVWAFGERSHSSESSSKLSAILHTLPVERIKLGPLDESAINALAQDRLGVQPSTRLRELLIRANGFPFHAVELIDGYVRNDSAVTDRKTIAPSIAGAHSRLQSLSVETMRLVQAAAVLGNASSRREITALAGMQPDVNATPAIEAAIDAGVLDDRGDEVRFRHDLLRQAVYEEILPAQRTALHRAAADRLLRTSALAAAPHILAYARRGDRDAARALSKAADAVSMTMPAMAAELIEHAFALTKNDDPAWIEMGENAMRLLMQAGRAADAIMIADKLSTAALSGEAAARVGAFAGRVLYESGNIAAARARAEAGLALPRISDPSLAALLALRALSTSEELDVGKVTGDAERALLLARSSGNRSAEADARLAMATAFRSDGRHLQALDQFRELRLLLPERSPSDEILSLQLLDRYDESAAVMRQASAQGEDTRDIPKALLIALARTWQSYETGTMDEGEAECRTLLRLCEDLQDDGYRNEATLLLSRIAQLRGDLERSAVELETIRQKPEAIYEPWLSRVAMMEAYLAERSGDATSALRYVRSVFESEFERPHWRWAAHWHVAAVRIAMAGRDYDMARSVATMAETLLKHNPAVPTVAGIAAYAIGMSSGNIETLREAAQIIQACPRPIVRAYVLVGLGREELAAGNREAGVQALDAARDVYMRAGAAGEAGLVLQYLNEAGVRRRHSSVPRAAEGWDALTDAEKRVAGLIAEGYTNRSAASALYLSPNTVATHLRSIFGKLNVESRSQLTRFVLGGSTHARP